MCAEQAGQREAVDVGVDRGRVVAERGECGGEIRADRRFAHATLAGGDRENARLRAGFVERVFTALRLEIGDKRLQLAFVH